MLAMLAQPKRLQGRSSAALPCLSRAQASSTLPAPSSPVPCTPAQPWQHQGARWEPLQHSPASPGADPLAPRAVPNPSPQREAQPCTLATDRCSTQNPLSAAPRPPCLPNSSKPAQHGTAPRRGWFTLPHSPPRQPGKAKYTQGEMSPSPAGEFPTVFPSSPRSLEAWDQDGL